MSKFTAPLVLALSVLSGTANADFLGLYVGGGLWNHSPAGTFGTTNAGSSTIDLESDLAFSSDSDTYFYAAFDHFVPFVPNVRIESVSMGHTGTATNVNFNGVAGISGDSSISLDALDTILYWRLLDNWVNFDFGFNFRRLDAEFVAGTETVSLSKSAPLLYISAQFDLPFSGFSVGADINKVSISDVSYKDMRIRALYEMGVIGFEAGLRSTSIDLDNVGRINSDLEFKGMTIGMFLHF